MKGERGMDEVMNYISNIRYSQNRELQKKVNEVLDEIEELKANEGE